VAFGVPAAAGGEDSTLQVQQEDRRKFLLRYVQTVQPDDMDTFVDQGPHQVLEAMRQTIQNITGTLPPEFFAITVQTRPNDLAQLMYSAMVTGYVFRNVQYRLELRSSMLPSGDDIDGYGHWGKPALPIMTVDCSEAPGYAPGTQKSRVAGEVLKWHHENGMETIPAAEYIEQLESQISILKQQVSTQLYINAAGNEVLNYLKGLEHDQASQLSAAGDDSLEAFNTFIQRLMGHDLRQQDMEDPTESTAVELAHLLFWCMVVGYNLRTLETRFDMESTMLLPGR
jgi:hypothetical protein